MLHSDLSLRHSESFECLFCKSHLLSVIWKVWYPAMNDANLVRLCFPDPPTPTSRPFPCGVRRIREIRIRWVIASCRRAKWKRLFVSGDGETTSKTPQTVSS